MEFITSNSWNISGEAIPVVMLVTDVVGEGQLGVVTIFCHHDQSKMEASNVLSALHQCNPLEPSVVVVRRYTNTPYIHQGSSHLPYLDMSTLSRGASSTQFSLDWLCLCRLLPFSDTKVVLPWEEGDQGWKCFPIFKRLYGKVQKRNTAPLTQFHCHSLHWSLISVKKRAPRQREDWAFTQPSSSSKMSIKPELSWNVSWSRKHRSWLEDTVIGRSNLPGDVKGGQHGWLNRQMPLFKRSFPRWAWLPLSSYYLGAFPLQFSSTICVVCWPPTHNRMRTSQLPPLHLSLRAYQLQASQAVQFFHLELHHFQYLLYQISLL